MYPWLTDRKTTWWKGQGMGHEMCLLWSRLALEWRGPVVCGKSRNERGLYRYNHHRPVISPLELLLMPASEGNHFAFSIPLCAAHINPTHGSRTWFRTQLLWKPFLPTLTSSVILYFNHTNNSIEPFTMVTEVNLSANGPWVPKEHSSCFILSISIAQVWYSGYSKYSINTCLFIYFSPILLSRIL